MYFLDDYDNGQARSSIHKFLSLIQISVETVSGEKSLFKKTYSHSESLSELKMYDIFPAIDVCITISFPSEARGMLSNVPVILVYLVILLWKGSGVIFHSH